MKIIQLTNSTLSQMMGYVVVAKTGEVLVVDGGAKGDGNELKRIIKSVGGYVDLWLITHPHSDHHTAVMEVLDDPEGITYGKLGTSQLPDSWAEGMADCKELYEWNEYAKKLDGRYFDLQKGQVFNLGSMKIEILSISNPEITVNPFNNQSSVIRVTEDGFTMLFLGDLGVEASRKLLRENIDLRADGVQLAHHGQQGARDEFYKEVQPRYAFWATPDWLWKNIPFTGGEEGTGPFKTQETAQWMKELNVKNIFAFTHTVVFDTENEQVSEY